MKHIKSFTKLFEDHKETLDKIEDLEKRSKSEKQKILDDYKSMLDEYFYDVSDDYDTESYINTNREPDSRGFNFITYTVYFNIDDYDDVESRLKAILTRLHDTHGVTHRLDGVFLVETNNSLQKIPGRTSQMRFPFDFEEARRIIKRTPESKLALSISL